MMDLVFIYFLSLLFYFSGFPFILFLVFILVFFILDLSKECDVTSHAIITQVIRHEIGHSYKSRSCNTEKVIEVSRTNVII